MLTDLWGLMMLNPTSVKLMLNQRWSSRTSAVACDSPPPSILLPHDQAALTACYWQDTSSITQLFETMFHGLTSKGVLIEGAMHKWTERLMLSRHVFQSVSLALVQLTFVQNMQAYDLIKVSNCWSSKPTSCCWATWCWLYLAKLEPSFMCDLPKSSSLPKTLER